MHPQTRGRHQTWAVHGGMRYGNVPGLTHMAHLLPPRLGSLPGLLLAKAAAEPRHACRGDAPPRSQNNQGQNWRHQAKSHREGLLRLSRTSHPRGLSGACQDLASIPAAGTIPPSAKYPPR